MTTHYRTKGFVFKKDDRAEANKSFSVFTEDYGRVEIVGRGIRKINSKLRGGIDIFCLSEIEFIQGKAQKILTDAVFKNRFGTILKDLEKLKTANKIAEVIDDFVRGQEKDKKIWDLSNDIFKKMDSQTIAAKSNVLAYYYFLWNFLSVLGYHPELKICVMCRQKLNPHSLYFSSKDGGVICENCAERTCPEEPQRRRINSDIVKILRLILEKDWQTISRLRVGPEAQNLLDEVSKDYQQWVWDRSISFKNNLRIV